MALAGLRETWRSPAGERVRSFTIVTTTPNELCAELHDRMPVVLNSAAMRGDRTRSLTRMEAPPRSCFVADSPLEGDGFEPSVPGEKPWVPSGKHFADSCRQAIRLSYSRTLRGC
jgi:hypothetical protein